MNQMLTTTLIKVYVVCQLHPYGKFEAPFFQVDVESGLVQV